MSTKKRIGFNSIYIIGHLKSSIVSQDHLKVKQGCPRLSSLNMFSFVGNKIENDLH